MSDIPNKIPKWCIIRRGSKKVHARVLCYTGNGYFDVLLPGDIGLHIHRDQITFI